MQTHENTHKHTRCGNPNNITFLHFPTQNAKLYFRQMRTTSNDDRLAYDYDFVL